MDDFRRGTQVAYVPAHVQEQGGSLKHPDVEFGFVTSVKDIDAFVRYWRKGHIPTDYAEIEYCLRTRANSERTPLDLLVEFHSIPNDIVEVALDIIDRETSF